MVVNERGYCRLCSRQATVINNRRPTHRTLDVAALNQHGQQLFFAELILKKRRLPPDTPDPPRQPMRWPARYPLAVELLALFPFTRRLDRGIVDRLGPPPIPGLADALHHPVGDHGARHGWSDDQCELTWRGIRLLLSMQDAPGTRIAWSEINLLLHLELTSVQSVIDVLTAVDMFHDDRPAPLAAWFDERVVGIAEPMRTELTAWFQVLRDGSTSPPRRKPRNIATVRSYVSTVLPALHTWGSNGHRSLREITRDDVINALAASDDERALLSGLRSLFSYLKARKLTFINPTAKLRTVRYQPAVPLAVDLAPIRAALHSDDPARACLTALLAFHAVRVDDLTHLQLIDVRDGRLYIGDHHLVLADPARARLNAWLDERTRRWPNSINAHLFIHSRSAGRTRAVTPDWIALTVGIPPSRIRQDRILHEAFASGGDARRLCDLFGISVPTAERYVAATRPDEHTLTNTAGTVSS